MASIQTTRFGRYRVVRRESHGREARRRERFFATFVEAWALKAEIERVA